MTDSRLFSIIVLLGVLAFLLSCYAHIRLLTLGKRQYRFDRPLARLRGMLRYAFAQQRVLRLPFGWNHVLLFYALLVLVPANVEFLLHGYDAVLGLNTMPLPAHKALACLFDCASALALLSVLFTLARRLCRPTLPVRTTRSLDSYVVPVMLVLLLCAYFGMHAGAIARHSDEAAAAMPISAALARLLPYSKAAQWGTACWWAYAVILLLLLNYLPYSKHRHILTAMPNCFLRRLDNANLLPVEAFARGNTYGAGQLDRFTWKDLFDGYACTECGRCREACPASGTGKPLDPQQVIQQMHINLQRNGAQMLSGHGPSVPLIGAGAEGSISEEAIWACTGCGACMEVCPVCIEQMPKLLLLRRHLVEMEAKFPAELLGLFERVEQYGNPWGLPAATRTDWAAQHTVLPFAPETEYLFFVGCSGAFDERGQRVTRALADILDAAGLSWGVLGEEEPCCGDSLRRLGNEYLFARMAEENTRLFRARGVKTIVTSCPHCYATLKNDYRQFGADFEVIHHSELLEKLLAQGKLPLTPVTALGHVVIHDACYLGRHNNSYQAPRAALAAAIGQQPGELPRHHEHACCCGAGGGHLWLEERPGTRINHARVQEALQTAANTVCVSCPYCLTMFEEGLRAAGAEERMQVLDVAEVVAEGLRARDNDPEYGLAPHV